MINRYIEVRIMQLLYKNKDGLTSAQIAKRLCMKPENLKEILDCLVSSNTVMLLETAEGKLYIARMERNTYKTQIAVAILDELYDGDIVKCIEELTLQKQNMEQ